MQAKTRGLAACAAPRRAFVLKAGRRAFVLFMLFPSECDTTSIKPIPMPSVWGELLFQLLDPLEVLSTGLHRSQPGTP